MIFIRIYTSNENKYIVSSTRLPSWSSWKDNFLTYMSLLWFRSLLVKGSHPVSIERITNFDTRNRYSEGPTFIVTSKFRVYWNPSNEWERCWTKRIYIPPILLLWTAIPLPNYVWRICHSIRDSSQSILNDIWYSRLS